MVVLLLGISVPAIPGGPFLFYFFVFLFGFVAVADVRFMCCAERYRVPALIGGVILALFWVFAPEVWGPLADSWLGGAGLTISAMAGVWLMLMGILGFGKRYLDRASPAQRYLAEASYPLYILHQTVIVVLAFYVVDLSVSGPGQWFILFLGSVLSTLFVYEIVRRVPPLRFLLGMRARRRRAERPPAGRSPRLGKDVP